MCRKQIQGKDRQRLLSSMKFYNERREVSFSFLLLNESVALKEGKREDYCLGIIDSCKIIFAILHERLYGVSFHCDTLPAC